MAENFPNLGGKQIQVQEAQRTPNKMNPKRTTPRNILVKVVKVIQWILKSARKKTTYYVQEKPHKVIRFFVRNFIGQKGVAWQIQSTERKKFPTKARLPFRTDGEINKSFTDKQKQKEFITIKPALQEMLTDLPKLNRKKH